MSVTTSALAYLADICRDVERSDRCLRTLQTVQHDGYCDIETGQVWIDAPITRSQLELRTAGELRRTGRPVPVRNGDQLSLDEAARRSRVDWIHSLEHELCRETLVHQEAAKSFHGLGDLECQPQGGVAE